MSTETAPDSRTPKSSTCTPRDPRRRPRCCSHHRGRRPGTRRPVVPSRSSGTTCAARARYAAGLGWHRTATTGCARPFYLAHLPVARPARRARAGRPGDPLVARPAAA